MIGVNLKEVASDEWRVASTNPRGPGFLQRCQKKGVEMRGSAKDVKRKRLEGSEAGQKRLEGDFHGLS